MRDRHILTSTMQPGLDPGTKSSDLGNVITIADLQHNTTLMHSSKELRIQIVDKFSNYRVSGKDGRSPNSVLRAIGPREENILISERQGRREYNGNSLQEMTWMNKTTENPKTVMLTGNLTTPIEPHIRTKLSIPLIFPKKSSKK